MKRTAVVTGANRGIGLTICRELARKGLHVVLTSRDEAKGRAAGEALRGEQLDVSYHRLDVTKSESVAALAEHLKRTRGGLDVLVNNAGASLEGFNADVARDTLEVNFFGPLRTTDGLLAILRPLGRIVMVTSGLGDRGSLSAGLAARFEHPEAMKRDELIGLMQKFVEDVAAGEHASAGWPSSAYRVSKIGLNALTAILGRELARDGRDILCNAASPGWVRTDMGGASAPRSVEQGAETPVWLALLPEGGPQGGVFADKAEAAW